MSAPSILILCTGNSCRSQMAEGYFRALAGDRFRGDSAGMTPKDRVHPLAVEVMTEDGVDTSAHRPKDLSEFLGRTAVSYLVIVCSRADESCPNMFPGMGQRLYWPFDDPDAYQGDDVRTEFRRVRDEIKARIENWLAAQ